ncbi:hypothetical protein [Paraburkholderia sp. J41]|uniref:hypothetical protein n=1 Tax=Paraburkholderia sp. J41 TaxID=2805433 RepID=UPI002AC3505D|nr:hypothetical protein [Paraburkholderia sp. J41]
MNISITPIKRNHTASTIMMRVSPFLELSRGRGTFAPLLRFSFATFLKKKEAISLPRLSIFYFFPQEHDARLPFESDGNLFR